MACSRSQVRSLSGPPFISPLLLALNQFVLIGGWGLITKISSDFNNLYYKNISTSNLDTPHFLLKMVVLMSYQCPLDIENYIRSKCVVFFELPSPIFSGTTGL